MEDNYITFKTNKGEINIVYSDKDDFDGLEMISDNITQNTDISESKIEKIFNYFKEKNLSVSLLSSLEINEKYRGKGEGKKLLERYEKEIMNKTDVDVLIARTENKQNKGFILEKFYEKYGFKGIILDSGDLLMFSKGYDMVLEEYLNLDQERKKMIDYLDKNEKVKNKNQKLYDFLKNKIEEKEKKEIKNFFKNEKKVIQKIVRLKK